MSTTPAQIAARLRADLSPTQVIGFAATVVIAFVVYRLGDDAAFGIDPGDLLTGTVLVGAVSIAATLPARRAVVAAVALVAIWLGGYGILHEGPGWLDLGVSVHDAVGGAAFAGSSYLDHQMSGALMILATAAGAVLVSVLLARRGWGPRPAVEPAGAPAGTHRRRLLLTLAGGILVALTLLPDLDQVLIQDSRGALPGGWDYANLITWDWLQQRGLTPMGDYWYPYGSNWLLQDYPLGPAFRWGAQCLLLAALGWALWRLLGPRPGLVTLCLLAMVLVGLLDEESIIAPPSFWRYVPGLVLAVVYAGVGPLRHRRLTRGHLVFGLICALSATMEADVLLAGLAGAAFVALGELAFDRGLRTRDTLRAVLVDLTPVAAGIAFMLLVWTATGTLDENVRFFAGVRGVSAASAANQDQFGALMGLTADPSLTTALVIVPALLLVLGVTHRHAGDERSTASARLLFAAAGFTSIILAKHLVRPQGAIVLYAPLVILAWSVLILWRPTAPLRVAAAGLYLGVLLAALQTSAAIHPTDYLTDVVETPVRAVDNAQLVLDRDEVTAAANARFAPERFAGEPEKLFIADPLGPKLAGPGQNRFAVLGDAQILYILFSQRPPDHINFYDSSRRDEQRRYIDALEEIDPRRLVWRRDFAIDGLAYWTRNPLIFAHVIRRWVPETRGNPYDVLRRRRPGEPVALGFWRARLGGIDLGAIPSYSKGVDAERCSDGPDCVQYAVMRGTGNGNKVPIEVNGPRGRFAFSFTARPGVDRYAVRLDRLWFWPYVGAGARLRSATPGWRIEQRSLKTGDDLY